MTFFEQLGQRWLTMLDFPAVVFGLILLLGGWVLWKTQKNPDNNFQFEDMLRDDSGKPSAYRLAIFVSLAVSTWVIMYMAIATDGKLDTWIFAWYIAVWSGAKVAEKGIEAYASRGQSSQQSLPSLPFDRPMYNRGSYQQQSPYQRGGVQRESEVDIPDEEPSGINSLPPSKRSQ